jgi:hypothetical protein
MDGSCEVLTVVYAQITDRRLGGYMDFPENLAGGLCFDGGWHIIFHYGVRFRPYAAQLCPKDIDQKREYRRIEGLEQRIDLICPNTY